MLLPLGGHCWRLTLFAVGSFVALAEPQVSDVMTLTFRGTFVPTHLLGRVTAASRIFVYGAVPFCAATAGLLVSALRIRFAVWALAVLYLMAPAPAGHRGPHAARLPGSRHPQHRVTIGQRQRASIDLVVSLWLVDPVRLVGKGLIRKAASEGMRRVDDLDDARYESGNVVCISTATADRPRVYPVAMVVDRYGEGTDSANG